MTISVAVVLLRADGTGDDIDDNQDGVCSMLSPLWWSSLARSLLPWLFFVSPFLLEGVSHPIAVVLLCLILRQ